MSNIVQERRRQTFRHYIEQLIDASELDMVLIPGGTFLMGSPNEEIDRQKNEGPQHKVTVPTFFMGRYPITQTQWRFVARLPKINQKLNAETSRFKGKNHPVERISWYDAVEFCTRLSIYTNRDYRLPSEAEWEYACRAGTVTPFFFGETITTECANYNGEYAYSKGPKGINRKQTIPVGSLNASNAFGLADMHGNVAEWCADDWHKDYEGAPSDGSVWFSENRSSFKLLRGGSWTSSPKLCRSACRDSLAPDLKDDFVGFRVACSVKQNTKN